MNKNVCIIGGCGHVGIPLGLALARVGHKVTLLDINESTVMQVNDGQLPFIEEGAEEILKGTIGKSLFATTKPEFIREAEVVVFVTGTPVDEHLNPRVHDFASVIKSYLQYLTADKLIVLRSTVYPGVVEYVDDLLKTRWGTSKLAFCPERILQGKGIEEIQKLPQIISATSAVAEAEAKALFLTIAPKVVTLEPKEAEIAKLMTNSWRYLEFAAANQFYMMIEAQGLDFFKIFSALREDYPRAGHFPAPGLTAGPCLFKDTMQLSAFHKNNFFLGQAAMLINEGLPNFVVDQLEKKFDGVLKGKTIAILGMTFKPNNDDTRESLSFKLKKVLEMKMVNVITTDPYLKSTVPFSEAVEKADGVILGVPHREYAGLKIQKPFVDCWGYWRNQK